MYEFSGIDDDDKQQARCGARDRVNRDDAVRLRARV
jgi:hypothetical protein